MTTPTTPEQAYKLAREAWTWSDQHEQAAALESLAEQVEALTTERDECLTLANEAKPLIEKLIAERDALKPDAERYQKLRARTKAQRGSSFDQMWLILPDVKRLPDQNIMQGSVAQHLDTAVDAMEAAS